MKSLLCLIAILLVPLSALACVDTKDGTFCVTTKDIAQSSWEHELSLTRTYNSKSTSSGWFGYGWATPFETRLMVMPDGSAVVYYPESGKVDRYRSQENLNLPSGVDKIVAVAIEKEGFGNEAASALKSHLILDEEFRRAQVLHYNLLSQLSSGTKLNSNLCSNAYVTRIQDEYKRNNCNNEIDYFDLQGRLIRHENGDYKYSVHYDGDHPNLIEDSLGQKLLLKWRPNGHVAEVTTSKEAPVATYRYDDKDNLVFGSDSDGNDADYTYDLKHKLTATLFKNNSRRDLQYDEEGRVTSFHDIDNELITYSYRVDPLYPSLHSWTTAATWIDKDKQKVRVAEYYFTLDSEGIKSLSRVIKTDGVNKEEITIDEKGRTKTVQKTDGGYIAYTYHATLEKIISVATNEGKTDFSYDAQGNMNHAATNNGRQITLVYDKNKNITRFVEINKSKHENRKLTFKYEAHHKPVKISLYGKGSINVKYDSFGEIAKVGESKKGSGIALEVTRAFSELLAIVKFAAVSYCL
jgi:hypothetical protein